MAQKWFLFGANIPLAQKWFLFAKIVSLPKDRFLFAKRLLFSQLCGVMTGSAVGVHGPVR
jgi:hypothetical protein